MTKSSYAPPTRATRLPFREGWKMFGWASRQQLSLLRFLVISKFWVIAEILATNGIALRNDDVLLAFPPPPSHPRLLLIHGWESL